MHLVMLVVDSCMVTQCGGAVRHVVVSCGDLYVVGVSRVGDMRCVYRYRWFWVDWYRYVWIRMWYRVVRSE